MLKVIVTGATGFIGKALVNQLADEGYEIYAIVRDENKKHIFSELENVKIVLCDLANIESLKNILKVRDFAYFFHLAWDGTGGPAREDYEKQLANIKYTCEAVKAAKELGCERFIYAGSLMEYESIKYVPIPGSKPALNYIYRTAKLTAHYMAKAISVNLGMDFVTGTVSNAYGEGEVSLRFINSTLRSLLNNEKTSFTAGEQLYDFIYITDVANAFIKIALEGKPYSNYYIGNKVQRKLKHFLLELRDCVDENIQLGIGEIPFDGISLDYTELDVKNLYEDTSFECKVNFKEGIKKTIEWLKS